MEVAIVGAGPAGSFCAERLAARGHSVAVFDPSHPREKPCGGGVTPGAFQRFPELRELRRLGRPARRVRLRGPDGAALEVELPAPIDVFSRERLDSALLERAAAAGARHLAQRVRRVRVDGDTAWVESREGASAFDFVVGADGAGSVVRRCLLGGRPGGAASYATAGFHVEGLPERDLYIEFLPEVKGYFWVFPRPGHSSAGIALPLHHQNGAQLRARVLEVLERRYPGSPSLPRRPYAASIPSPTAAQARRPGLGGVRFALVGDAASQVDAITGEGIHQALAAAAALADALHGAGPLRAAQTYARAWRRDMGRELVHAALWAQRYYRPWATERLLRLATRSRRARGVMADLLAMQQPYSTLRRRLLREAVAPGYPPDRSTPGDGVE